MTPHAPFRAETTSQETVMQTKETTVTADEKRARLHGMWARVAPAWGEHADFADERGAGLTRRLLELAAPKPGDRVLELACGAGGLGLAAARLVAPGGHVVCSDVVPEMTAIADSRSAELGLGNVSTLVLDLEGIEQGDATYDLVLCREGLMFALDPARAAHEIGRVLCPGGRAVVAVWGPRERNPWLGLVLDAVSAQVGSPVPPPGVPGPFSLEDPDELAALLTDAGLTEVVVGEQAVPTNAASFEEWWTRTCALAGPLANVLANLPEEAAVALRDRAREAAASYATGRGYEFPGVSLVATGRRPV
jgi:ubiquinone/menaquinone biosynthesis C-methylase UbiE